MSYHATLTMKLTQPKGDFKVRMDNKLRELAQGEKAALAAGARKAESVSRGRFVYKRPANAPRRPGRSSTGGKLMKHVRWVPQESGLVELNAKELDQKAPHWIIHEIGTGQRATMRRAGVKNPRGRARKGASHVRTVKAQHGRRISAGLAFGDSPGGKYFPPGAGSRQQLYVRAGLRGRGPISRAKRIVISNEIKGQHFVRDGAREGFLEYRTSMRAAARRAFAGQKYR